MKKTSKNKGGTSAKELIRESMRCPVCMEVLLSPIYQCERGHNICNMCVEEVHECPLCKGDYGDTRNYFAEDLVNSMTLACKYEEYGCPTTCLGSQLRDHQENCEYQPYRCPELACQELIGQGQMDKHLERHGFKIMLGESHLATIEIEDHHFDKKKTEYNPWRIQTFGREFYTVASRQRDKNWYFWSWCLSLPKEAKKYSSEIILSSSEKQVLYRGSVHSLRTPPEEIIKSAQALVLTDHLIKAMRENGKITCKVRFIEGKNWDKETKKEAKQFTNSKKENRKIMKISNKKPVTLPLLTKTPTSTPVLGTIKKNSKVSLLNPGVKTSKASLVPAVPKISATKAPIGGHMATGVTPKGVPLKVKTITSFKKPGVSDAEQNVFLKIRESLKCPGCHETVSPPIFLCTVGHSVCDTCRIKYSSSCPLCRCPITGTRNFFAEELLYKTVTKCRYHASGCDVCLPAVQIRMHERICDFAPYECPFSTCRKVFEPKDLLDHMKSHEIPLVKNELKITIPFPKCSTCQICTIPSILIAHGLAFYPLVIRESSGTWSFWVACNDPVKYVYELQIKKKSKVLAFQGTVMSLRMNPNQIILRGEGLITIDKAIQNFKGGNKFDFALKIAPIKGFIKSGVTFLTRIYSGSKLDTNTTKTELYANKRTSKCQEEDDDDSIYNSRHSGQYSRLFTDYEDEDGDDECEIPSPGSRSSQSLKKSKSECLESDYGDSDEFLDGENKTVETVIAKKSTSFCAVDFGDGVAGAIGGDELLDGQKVSLNKSKSNTKVSETGQVHVEKLRNSSSSPASGKEGKKKSALKEKVSQKDIRLKETSSLKKVEFNPTAEIFLENPITSPQQTNDINNNWIQQDEVEKASTLTSTLSQTKVLSEIQPSSHQKTIIVPKLHGKKIKPNYKLEVLSRSCKDMKVCGSRELMKNKLRQLSCGLASIPEEDEENYDMEADNKRECKGRTSSSPRFKVNSSSCNKKEPESLIGPKSQEKLVMDTTKGSQSYCLGEFDSPVELIIRTEDKVASVSLSNIIKSSEASSINVHSSSSDGHSLSNFDLEIPIKLTDSSEFVEEMDTACQVGSSLSRLIEWEANAPYRSESLVNLNMSQNLETISEGLSVTFNTVKQIISGMIQPPSKPSSVTIIKGGKKVDEEIAAVL